MVYQFRPRDLHEPFGTYFVQGRLRHGEGTPGNLRPAGRPHAGATQPLFDIFRRSTSRRCAGRYSAEGRKLYIGEGCWHCHSQFVRPVSNGGPPLGAGVQEHEYQNELQRPVMFGTRRVGPDLVAREGSAVERLACRPLLQTADASPQSVMPEYPWFFDNDDSGKPSPGKPNDADSR